MGHLGKGSAFLDISTGAAYKIETMFCIEYA